MTKEVKRRYSFTNENFLTAEESREWVFCMAMFLHGMKPQPKMVAAPKPPVKVVKEVEDEDDSIEIANVGPNVQVWSCSQGRRTVRNQGGLWINDHFRQEYRILRLRQTRILTFPYLSVLVLNMSKLVQVILKVKMKATMNPFFGIQIRLVFILIIPAAAQKLKLASDWWKALTNKQRNSFKNLFQFNMLSSNEYFKCHHWCCHDVTDWQDFTAHVFNFFDLYATDVKIYPGIDPFFELQIFVVIFSSL